MHTHLGGTSINDSRVGAGQPRQHGRGITAGAERRSWAAERVHERGCEARWRLLQSSDAVRRGHEGLSRGGQGRATTCVMYLWCSHRRWGFEKTGLAWIKVLQCMQRRLPIGRSTAQPQRPAARSRFKAHESNLFHSHLP